MVKLRHKKEFFVGLSVAITIFLALVGANSVMLYRNDKAATITQFKGLSARVNSDMSQNLNNIDVISRTNFINEDFSETAAALFTEEEHEAVISIQNLFQTIISASETSLIGAISYFPYGNEGAVDTNHQVLAGSLIDLTLVNAEKIIRSSEEYNPGNLYTVWASYANGEYAAYLFFSRVILDMRVENYNAPIGIVSMCVSIPTLSAPLSYASTLNGSSFFLLDRDSKILLSSNPSIQSIDEVKGGDYYNLSLRLGFLDWQFFGAQNTSVVWSNLRLSFIIEGSILLFIVVGYTIIYLMAYRRSQQGLGELFDFFYSHESSSLEKMAPSTDDEVNRVVGAYNTMVESVIALNEQVVEERNRGLSLELEKSNMEIQALHSQINKHFLVNALSVIRSYISLHHVEQAKACLESLSDFLRYSLTMEDSSTIGQELATSKDYLLIQKARYPGVDYDIDCPEELYSIVIPKVTLQPLLENAFTHGLRKKKGHIHIAVFLEDEHCVIEVSNTGTPQDRKRMEEVNASLRGERKDEIKKDSHGIAMANIKRRFELSFGEGVEVLLKEKEGNTVATIRFPKGKENNNDSRLPN